MVLILCCCCCLVYGRLCVSFCVEGAWNISCKKMSIWLLISTDRLLGVVFDYYIIVMCMGTGSESNYALCNIQRSLSFTEITSVFATMWQRKWTPSVRNHSQYNFSMLKYSGETFAESVHLHTEHRALRTVEIPVYCLSTLGHSFTSSPSHLLECFLSSLSHFFLLYPPTLPCSATQIDSAFLNFTA